MLSSKVLSTSYFRLTFAHVPITFFLYSVLLSPFADLNKRLLMPGPSQKITVIQLSRRGTIALDVFSYEFGSFAPRDDYSWGFSLRLGIAHRKNEVRGLDYINPLMYTALHG